MSHKTILVTGATSGIGEATARALAAQGHTVLVHGRTQSKDYTADFGDLDAVRAMAAQVASDHPELSVLVNNAGAWLPTRQLSAQGIELTFAANHLAPFVLTRALLPTLERNAGRVVTVSSALHTRGRTDFEGQLKAMHYSGMKSYNDSKLANALFAFELARRHPAITSNALHPGLVRSGLASGKAGFSAWFFSKVMQPLIGISTEEGAQTSVFLASDPSVQGVTGRYFSKCAEVQPSADAQDPELGARLWELSERLTS